MAEPRYIENKNLVNCVSIHKKESPRLAEGDGGKVAIKINSIAFTLIWC